MPPKATDVIISGTIAVGSTLTVSYNYEGTNPEGNTEFQRYRNGEMIDGEIGSTYVLKITDQSCDIVCAVCPFDDQGNFGEIVASNVMIVEFYSTEVKPIEKQYIVKVYDKDMNFLKVIPAGIITNDITISETIDGGQGEMKLTLNLPIATNYFENVKYCKVYMNDNRGTDNLLLYSGRLTKVSRKYSNNKENIEVTFLSLRALLDEVVLRKDGDHTFSKTGDPANTIKFIIDYFSTIYPNILSYTNESIQDYGTSVTIKFEGISCQKALKNLVNGLSFYLFIGADGVVYYKPTPATATHLLTYEKDINSLTIPENYEDIKNTVQVIRKNDDTETDTTIATDETSVETYGTKEILIKRLDVETETGANEYRDNYIAENKDMKENVSVVVNALYKIETLHPGQTIKIRNLGLNITNAQIQNVKYTYDQATLTLEYYTTIGQQIFNQ